jgi:hypothetical protein
MDRDSYAGRVLQKRIDRIGELLSASPEEILVDDGNIIVPERRELLAFEREALVAILDSFDRRVSHA